jgi:hypothetical protein
MRMGIDRLERGIRVIDVGCGRGSNVQPAPPQWSWQPC